MGKFWVVTSSKSSLIRLPPQQSDIWRKLRISVSDGVDEFLWLKWNICVCWWHLKLFYGHQTCWKDVRIPHNPEVKPRRSTRQTGFDISPLCLSINIYLNVVRWLTALGCVFLCRLQVNVPSPCRPSHTFCSSFTGVKIGLWQLQSPGRHRKFKGLCFTSALATSTSGCRLSISSRALVPPFLTPIIIAPGSRCWVLLWAGEEEEGDEEEEEE